MEIRKNKKKIFGRKPTQSVASKKTLRGELIINQDSSPVFVYKNTVINSQPSGIDKKVSHNKGSRVERTDYHIQNNGNLVLAYDDSELNRHGDNNYTPRTSNFIILSHTIRIAFTAIHGLSADGRSATFWLYNPVSSRGGYWSFNNNIDEEFNLGFRQIIPQSINDTGNIVVGRIEAQPDETQVFGFKWQPRPNANNPDLQSFQLYDGPIYDVSSDGKVVCGFTYIPGTAQFQASYWIGTKPAVNLGFLGGENGFSTAIAVSGNGSVFTGQSTISDDLINYRAFKYTVSGGMQNLGVLAGDTNSQGWSISKDGSTIVGTSSTASTSQPFKYTTLGGMVSLGTLGTRNFGLGVNDNGSIIVGRYFGSDSSVLCNSQASDAFVWTSRTGMVNLASYAASHGVDIGSFGYNVRLLSCEDVSNNGLVFYGEAHVVTDFDNYCSPYILVLPSNNPTPSNPVKNQNFELG